MFKLLRRRVASQGDPRNTHRETTCCPQCGALATFLVASTDRNRHTTSAVFDYFRCGHCGLVFMDPIPDDLRPFYAGGYSTIPQTLEEFRIIAKPERYRLDSILPFKQTGKLLEIGPWMGTFSFNAKEAGFDVTAIEMDQACVDFMNHSLGLRALQSSDPADTLASMTEQFDVIALWHSLEHLREPWVVLERAAERLAPGGILLIAIPNIDSFEFEVLHASWRNLDAPRHIYFYPRHALTALCNSFGLVERYVTTTDTLSHHFSAETWSTTLSPYFPVPKVKALFWRSVKWLVNRRERAANSGPGMTALYERPAAPGTAQNGC